MKDQTQADKVTPARITIDEKLTRHVAFLARLALSEDEVRTFTPQLGEILNYVHQLQEVNVSDVEPLIYPFDLPAHLRADTVRTEKSDLEQKTEILKSAPEVLLNGFKVPPMI